MIMDTFSGGILTTNERLTNKSGEGFKTLDEGQSVKLCKEIADHKLQTFVKLNKTNRQSLFSRVCFFMQ
jgi:hypothetical protein